MLVYCSHERVIVIWLSFSELQTMLTRSYNASRCFLIAVVYVLFAVIIQLSCVATFYLQGSRTSYVRLPRWHSCSNSSLTLDFWTSLSDALLVYADDGGRSSFLVLSIDNGSVVAHISVATDDLAGGADHASTTLKAVSRRPVNDRHWHKVSATVANFHEIMKYI